MVIGVGCLVVPWAQQVTPSNKATSISVFILHSSRSSISYHNQYTPTSLYLPSPLPLGLLVSGEPSSSLSRFYASFSFVLVGLCVLWGSGREGRASLFSHGLRGGGSGVGGGWSGEAYVHTGLGGGRSGCRNDTYLAFVSFWGAPGWGGWRSCVSVGGRGALDSKCGL